MSMRNTLAIAVGVAAAMALSAASRLPAGAVFVLGIAGTTLILLAARRFRTVPKAASSRPNVPRDADLGSALRTLLGNLPSPLLIISKAGRVTFTNSAAEAVLPRLQPGMHFASLIRAPAFVEAVTETLMDGRERRFEFTTSQGRERFFEARVGLSPGGATFGPEAHVIVQIEDRTEARRAELLRSDFIANASHELRTPLASILGYIETLQNHARNDPEARERFLIIMSREAARMQRLVDDLMSLSRIELSEHLRPVEEWSLHAIAAESAAALLPLARQQGVDLDIDIVPSGATVLGDRDQLAQIFANLIDNAMKYAGPGHRVHLFAAPPNKAHPNRCGVTVADDGPGIGREHVHRLTERFYRVNVSSSRNKGGTGLGLAIVKHILNRHEGRLEIVSEPGMGSAFTVWLPRRADDASAAEPKAESGVPWAEAGQARHENVVKMP